MYGGGEPRLDIELRGRTMGGEQGVKRKGWEEGTAVADVARLRVGVRLLEEVVRLRRLGVAVEGLGTRGNNEVLRSLERVVKVRSAPLRWSV